MKKINEDVLSVLQELTEFVNDRIEGYEYAAKETRNPNHTSFYLELSNQSGKFADELNSLIEKHEGSTETDTTIKGKFYRQWMELKATLTGSDDNAIINASLYGEEWAQKAYNDALNNPELPDDIRKVIEKQKQASQKAHDQLEKMKK